MARRSRDSWRQLVAEAERTTYEATARRHGVRAKTLRWWQWNLRDEPRVGAAGAVASFLPVVVRPTMPVAISAQPNDEVAIELAAGVRVRVPVGVDPRYVAALVGALRSVC